MLFVLLESMATDDTDWLRRMAKTIPLQVRTRTDRVQQHFYSNFDLPVDFEPRFIFQNIKYLTHSDQKTLQFVITVQLCQY